MMMRINPAGMQDTWGNSTGAFSSPRPKPIHSPLVLLGNAAKGRAQTVYVEGHVTLVTHELLVRVLLAPAQVTGTHPAGLALIVLAMLAGGPALPGHGRLGSAQAGPAKRSWGGSPHPTPDVGATEGQDQNSLRIGFSMTGLPSPGCSILNTSSTKMIRQSLRESPLRDRRR